MATGPNLLTLNYRIVVIKLDTSSQSLISTSIFVLELFTAKPTATAITTIASTPPLFEKAWKRLLGTAFKIIINGFEPVEPVEAFTPASSAFEKAPSLYAVKPTIPASTNETVVVNKKQPIVFEDNLPSFLESEILTIAKTIDTNTIGTIIICNDLTNNCPIR